MKLIFPKFLFLHSALFFICSFNSAFSASLDDRYASIKCTSSTNTDQIICDYRVSPSLRVENIGARVGGKPVQLNSDSFKKYPADNQSTAVLFLVDTSDPSRRTTIEKRIVSDLFDIFTSESGKRTHLKYSLATFDTEFKVVSPFGASYSDSLNALSKIKADGLATEFYKSILDAIEFIKTVEASRKAIVILSDGKDEDRAYHHDDVVKAAKASQIVIMGLGYAEKKSDLPFLQTLKRLSDDTYGSYLNVTNKSSFNQFLEEPFAFIEKGGRVLIPSTGFYGNELVALEFGLTNSEKLVIDAKVDISDSRSISTRAIIFLRKHWLDLLLIISGVLVFGFLSHKGYKKYMSRKVKLPEYAFLQEKNGMGSKYIINKTAIRIGRSQDNDICLLNDSISSHHAELHITRGLSFFVVDLNSTNGVFVNGEKISQQELHDGDLIELGEVGLNFKRI